MNRESESLLVRFCVEQYGRFAAEAWSAFKGVSQAELAATARYLAGVDWYGRRAELGAVASQLSPRAFAELARETEFDAPRFAGLLRAHLRHAGQFVTA